MVILPFGFSQRIMKTIQKQAVAASANGAKAPKETAQHEA